MSDHLSEISLGRRHTEHLKPFASLPNAHKRVLRHILSGSRIVQHTEGNGIEPWRGTEIRLLQFVGIHRLKRMGVDAAVVAML